MAIIALQFQNWYSTSLCSIAYSIGTHLHVFSASEITKAGLVLDSGLLCVGRLTYYCSSIVNRPKTLVSGYMYIRVYHLPVLSWPIAGWLSCPDPWLGVSQDAWVLGYSDHHVLSLTRCSSCLGHTGFLEIWSNGLYTYITAWRVCKHGVVTLPLASFPWTGASVVHAM